MARALEASGFLGLTVMMAVGTHPFVLVAAGEPVPGWMIGGRSATGAPAED